MTLFWIILGFICGGLLIYVCLRPRLNAALELDQETAQRNAKIHADNQELDKVNKSLQEKQYILNGKINDLNHHIDNLNTQREMTLGAIRDLETQAKEAGELLKAEALQTASIALDEAATKLGMEYQQQAEEYQEEYLEVLREAAESYHQQLLEKKETLSSLESQLALLKSIVDAAVEEKKRAAAEQEQQDFYRLVLSEEDLQEIEKLREVLPYLRDKEPLNKVIYKVYYEKPYTDLIGRVLGQGIKTGIYKITNLLDGKCYVGQAANVSERWRQHIKRGVGAEAPTRNKLYPAMLSIGVENFTFELIEECSRTDLDSREDYWQEYFQAKEYGYSIK